MSRSSFCLLVAGSMHHVARVQTDNHAMTRETSTEAATEVNQ